MNVSANPASSLDVKALPVDLVRTDGGTQLRVELNQEAIDAYREKWLVGVEFEPVDVFFDGANHWLADGFHRYEAAKSANRASILARIRTGTLRDAILFAAGANDRHGVRLTRSDKKKAVVTLLMDEEWSNISSNWIAERCHVSPNTVEAYRREMQVTSQLHSSSRGLDAPRRGKDGKSRRLPQESSETPASMLFAAAYELLDKLAYVLDRLKSATGDERSRQQVADSLDIARQDLDRWEQRYSELNRRAE